MELAKYQVVPVLLIMGILVVILRIGMTALKGTRPDQRAEILRAIADVIKALLGRRSDNRDLGARCRRATTWSAPALAARTTGERGQSVL